MDPATVTPRCTRHPERETYISCTRCGAPICPDCMVSAPVGFQCPDCAGVAARSTASLPATVGRPTVTYALMAICGAVFAGEYLLGLNQAIAQWGMFPPAIAQGELFRLLTSAFLHASILHIAFNLYVLYALGPQLEYALGHWWYLALYLMAGIGGAVASYAFSSPATFSVGASGAIFGLMGALVVVGQHHGADIRQVLVLIGINVVIGFLPGGGIDWRAHLGGLVVGAAMAAILVKAPAQSQVLWRVLGVLALAGLLVAITMWRTAALQPYLVSGVLG